MNIEEHISRLSEDDLSMLEELIVRLGTKKKDKSVVTKPETTSNVTTIQCKTTVTPSRLILNQPLTCHSL